MGARSEEKILKALEAGVGDKAEARRLLGQALPAVTRVVAELAAHPAAMAVSEAGSVRRRRETVRDLDLIATSSDPPALIAAFCDGDWVSEVVARGDTKATVVEPRRPPLRPPRGAGRSATATCSSTSRARRTTTSRCARTRSAAGSRSPSTASRTSRRGEVVTHATEDELYAFLGYRHIPPELREGTAEIGAARDGALPELVELGDLRGEMHCHSTWSADGKNTLEEMALTAKSRGYRFLCITDHSHYLRDGRLEAQWKEID